MTCRACGLDGVAYASCPGICKGCKKAYARARHPLRVRPSQAGLHKKPEPMHRAFRALGQMLGVRKAQKDRTACVRPVGPRACQAPG